MVDSDDRSSNPGTVDFKIGWSFLKDKSPFKISDVIIWYLLYS